LITDGDVWLEMLEQRNLLAHTYDEELLKKAIELIPNKYFKEIKQVVSTLNNL
jgi:uncharacterized protein with HEPN domain